MRRRDLGRGQVRLAQVRLDVRGDLQPSAPGARCRDRRARSPAVRPAPCRAGRARCPPAARQSRPPVSSSSSAIWARNGPMSVAMPPASPGSRVAVSRGQPDCGRPSMSRGNSSTSIRCVAQRQRVRAVGVVEGEVARGEHRLPAVLDQHRPAAQLEADLVAAGRCRPCTSRAVRRAVCGSRSTSISRRLPSSVPRSRPRKSARRRGGDLERDERVGQDVLPVVETLAGGRSSVRATSGMTPASSGSRPSLRADARMVKGCAR